MLWTREADNICKGLHAILWDYNKGEFSIKTICCNREFKALIDPIMDDVDIEMNCTAKEQLVPEAKRNNYTIGKRI